jgi:hypothetical protein
VPVVGLDHSRRGMTWVPGHQHQRHAGHDR